MGGFFGKGKDKAKDKDKEQQSESKSMPAASKLSRRTVVAGATPTQRPTGPGKGPSTQRGVAARPVPQVMAKPKAPSSDSDNLVLSPGEMPSRPDTKGPITASTAPQFSGSISVGARTSGPCRTGDAALLEFLQNKAKLITPEQVDLITGKAQRDELAIDAAAVALNLFTEDQLVNALTQECWVPHLKVDKYEIRKKALDTIAREDAVHYSVFPVDKLGSLLTLAMVNPLDAETIRVLESKTGLDIKRVVATRNEIQQGVEKYYSGRVEAKDTSISFTADSGQEVKSVTQMLGNVRTAGDAGATIGGSSVPVASFGGDDILPEIQDIDDLLSADEIIAPAIIEPVKAIEIEAPLVVPAGEVFEISEPQIIDSSALEARTAAPRSNLGFDTPLPLPAAFTTPLPPPKTTRVVAAPEFELEDTEAIAPPIKPATEMRPAAYVPPPVAAPRPASAPVARPVTASIARPATGSINRPGSSSNLFPARTSTGRVANPKLVNLIPVLEEEFQHAITHGKAHVFEKWVGLQSRNRIINAVPMDAEFDDLLAGVYSSPVLSG